MTFENVLYSDCIYRFCDTHEINGIEAPWQIYRDGQVSRHFYNSSTWYCTCHKFANWPNIKITPFL